MRDGNYLMPDYSNEANALFDKYHRIEIDPNISIAEKKKAMNEWWRKHFELLIRSKLNKKDIEEIVQSNKIKLRKGALEFFEFLYLHKIPLVIISSSGLGRDAIISYLQNKGVLYENITVISNSFIWDENGNAVEVNEPIIHCMNKDETLIQKFPVFNSLKNRKNVVLLGDSLGDVGMINGFDYNHLIKIGFLNEQVKEQLEQYKNNYDVVILNDSSMDYVNELLKSIIKV